MADLSNFQEFKLVGANVTKTAELFVVTKSTVSKIMTSFEKEGNPEWSKTLEKSEYYLIGTVTLLRGLLGRITRKHLRKLQQSLMIISRTQSPQKL